MMGFGLMGGFGLAGLIFNLAILIGIIVLIVWAVRRLSAGSGNWGQSSGSQSPRDILQLRYARGEITREQYQQMLNDLT